MGELKRRGKKSQRMHRLHARGDWLDEDGLEKVLAHPIILEALLGERSMAERGRVRTFYFRGPAWQVFLLFNM